VAAVVGGSFSLADAGLKFVGGAAGDRDRPGGRLGDRRDPQAHRGRAGEHHDLAAQRATRRSCRPTRSAPRACWRRSPPASTWAPRAEHHPARTRLQGFFVWDILDFLLNAILFVLIGLQLRTVVDGLSGYSVDARRLRAGGQRRG
jgi:hypothetical protein